jgi:hypothetical protein
MLPFAKKEWSVDDLPKFAVSPRKKISRSEAIFSIFITILFFGLVFYKPFLLGWYQQGTSGTIITATLFNLDRLHLYNSTILIFTLIQLAILAYKLIMPIWNKPLVVVTAVFNIMLSGLVAIMATDPALINPEFIEYFAQAINSTFTQIVYSLKLAGWIFAVVFFGICVWDSVINFRRVKE